MQTDTIMNSIGLIHSPYTELSNMPIQPKGAKDITGHIVLFEEYVKGVKDLIGFSHIYLLYSFHRAERTEMMVTPFMDVEKRGVYSTRSPLRPNHIGLSIVELVDIQETKLTIRGVDILDGTPLLDIKPYIHAFDSVENSRSGWMQGDEEAVENKRSDSRFL